MARNNIYLQNIHTLVVDGFPITDFDEGDWIEWESMGNEGSITEGGDGPAMNISTEQGGRVTIKLKPTSPALGVMYELREAQRTNPRFITIVLLTGVQEVISASGCSFGKLAARTSGGPKMTPATFNFAALKIKHDTSAVESIAGGLLGG